MKMYCCCFKTITTNANRERKTLYMYMNVSSNKFTCNSYLQVVKCAKTVRFAI